MRVEREDAEEKTYGTMFGPVHHNGQLARFFFRDSLPTIDRNRPFQTDRPKRARVGNILAMGAGLASSTLKLRRFAITSSWPNLAAVLCKQSSQPCTTTTTCNIYPLMIQFKSIAHFDAIQRYMFVSHRL